MIDPNFVQNIFDYKEQIEAEEINEARDVAIDFKKQMMDPNRQVVIWERKLANDMKKKKKTIVYQ